jgi:hypothetical protein
MSESMSGDLLRRMQADDARLRQTETKEVPPLYLPWAQRIVNPFPLASSGAAWGDMGQPWGVNLLAFYVSVFVQTTNNATNFWIIRLLDTTGAVLARVDTNSPVATPGVWTRYADTVLVQPAAANAALTITCTAALSPGAIFIAPALALLRTGN